MKKILTSSVLVVTALFFSFFLPKTTFASTLGFFDLGPYQCNDVGIRGWACIPGQSTQVKVGFYSQPYDPNQSVEANLKNFIGETTANVSEGDDAAIDDPQNCNDPTLHTSNITPHRFHFRLDNITNPNFAKPNTITVYGYIEVNDGQLHPLGQDKQTFTCPLASSATSTCEPQLLPTSATPICEGVHGQPANDPNMCPATMPDNSVSVVNFSWKGCSTSTYDVQQVINGVAGGIIKVTGTTFRSPTVDCAINNKQATNEGFGGTSQGKLQQLKVKLDRSTAAGITIPFTPNVCPEGSTNPPVNSTPHTLLNVSLQLPGIGQAGNLSPKHQIRPLHVTIYPANTDLTTNPATPATFDSNKSPTSQSITFNSTTGFFANDSFDVGTLPTGDYEVFLKTPGYLRKSVLNTTDQTTTIHITGATTNIIPLTKLIAGDVATGDQGLSNVMESADFYQIVGCYKDKATTSTCINKDLADLNDDGTVDGIDLNYWLLGFQELQKNNNTQGNGDGAPGE